MMNPNPQARDRANLRIIMLLLLLVALFAVTVVALSTGKLHAAERRAFNDVRVVRWTSVRDGYSTSVLINATMDGGRWTFKCDKGLDPGGPYAGERDDDHVWLRYVTLKNESKEMKCKILARSWVWAQR